MPEQSALWQFTRLFLSVRIESGHARLARDITILYPVGTATMDTHRTLEKERKDKFILLETVLQSHSLSKLSNGDHTSDRIVIEGCGHIDTSIDELHNGLASLASSSSESDKRSSSCCLLPRNKDIYCHAKAVAQ